MGKSFVNEVLEAKKEFAKKDFAEFRETVDNARVGLALTAIKNRLEQDIAIAIAAYEMDQEIENAMYRVQKDPADGLADVLALKTRYEACLGLIEKYRAEIEAETEWRNAQIQEQMAELEAVAEVEDADGAEDDSATEQEVSGDE